MNMAKITIIFNDYQMAVFNTDADVKLKVNSGSIEVRGGAGGALLGMYGEENYIQIKCNISEAEYRSKINGLVHTIQVSFVNETYSVNNPEIDFEGNYLFIKSDQITKNER